MFDTSKPIEVQIFSGGIKTCRVRYPSDAEWREFFKSQSVVRQSSDDGMSEAKAVGIEAAAGKLMSQIRLDKDGAEFDDFDAAAAVRKLDYIQVTSSVIENDMAIVTVAALKNGKNPAFTDLRHTLRLPKQKQIIEFRRRSLRILEGHNRTDMRQPIEPGEEFYDALLERSEGYTIVPANHKHAIAEEVIAAIDRMLSDM